MINSADEWVSRKGDFNHRWLLNGYILFTFTPALDVILSGEEDSIIQDMCLELSQWEKSKILEYEDLLDSYLYCMTPSQLFDQHPLSELSDDLKSWAKPFINTKWKQSPGVKSRLGEAYKLLESLRANVSDLLRACKKEGEIDCSKIVNELELLKDHLAIVTKINKNMSKFPNRVGL